MLQDLIPKYIICSSSSELINLIDHVGVFEVFKNANPWLLKWRRSSILVLNILLQIVHIIFSSSLNCLSISCLSFEASMFPSGKKSWFSDSDSSIISSPVFESSSLAYTKEYKTNPWTFTQYQDIIIINVWMCNWDDWIELPQFDSKVVWLYREM